MPDAAWWRAYRAANRERLNAQLRERRARGRERGDRRAEHAKRRPRATPRLEPLLGELLKGTSVSYWEDELRLDLYQERALATLEGRDPDAAERTYRRKEIAWRANTVTWPTF